MERDEREHRVPFLVVAEHCEEDGGFGFVTVFSTTVSSVVAVLGEEVELELLLTLLRYCSTILFKTFNSNFRSSILAPKSNILFSYFVDEIDKSFESL